MVVWGISNPVDLDPYDMTHVGGFATWWTCYLVLSHPRLMLGK